MDIKQRLREARWVWCLPGLVIVLLCLLPSGHIEASPGQLFRPPVWMAPIAWPLLAMAVLFIGASFSERLRARAARIVFFGACASLLLEVVLSALPGNMAMYSFWLGTDLQKRIFVDFELDVIAFGFIPLDLLLVFFSFVYIWTRKPATDRAVPSPEIALAVPAAGPSGTPPPPLSGPRAPAAGPEEPAPAAGVPAAGPSEPGPPAGPSPASAEGAALAATMTQPAPPPAEQSAAAPADIQSRPPGPQPQNARTAPAPPETAQQSTALQFTP